MTNTPDGYMRNSAGHLVPLEQVREQDKLRDDVVKSLVDDALSIQKRLSEFKQRALNDIADVIQIAADKYDVELGGKKGNVSLSSYDGQYKVQRTYAERISFTEELEAAKALILNCIDRWSENANANIRALVDRAFKTNRNGELKTAEVLGLLRLEINDDDWQQAMRALKDSISVSGSTVYVRVYKRTGNSNHYTQIPLDLAGV